MSTLRKVVISPSSDPPLASSWAPRSANRPGPASYKRGGSGEGIPTGIAASEGIVDATSPGDSEVLEFGPRIIPSDPETDNPLVLDSLAEPEIRHTADFQLNPSGDDAASPRPCPSPVMTAPPITSSTASTPAPTLAQANSPASLATPPASSRLGRPPLHPAASASPTTAASSSTPPKPSSTVISMKRKTCMSGSPRRRAPRRPLRAEKPHLQPVLRWLPRPRLHRDQPFRLQPPRRQLRRHRRLLLHPRSPCPQRPERQPRPRLRRPREGGFPFIPNPVPCKASDECHGAGSPPPPSLNIQSVGESPRGNESPHHRRKVQGGLRQKARKVCRRSPSITNTTRRSSITLPPSRRSTVNFPLKLRNSAPSDARLARAGPSGAMTQGGRGGSAQFRA